MYARRTLAKGRVTIGRFRSNWRLYRQHRPAITSLACASRSRAVPPRAVQGCVEQPGILLATSQSALLHSSRPASCAHTRAKTTEVLTERRRKAVSLQCR